MLLIPITQSVYTPQRTQSPINITLNSADTPRQKQQPLDAFEQTSPVQAAPTRSRPKTQPDAHPSAKPDTANDPPAAVITQSTMASMQIFANRLVREEAEQERRRRSLEPSLDEIPLPQSASDSEHTVTELGNGRVAVVSSFLGKPVCYQFAPDGDPPIVFFEQCKAPKITIDLKQRSDG